MAKLRNPEVIKLHRAAQRGGKRTLSREAQLRLEARRKVRRVLTAALKAIATRAQRANRAVTRMCAAARQRVLERAKRERAEARAAINARRDAGLAQVRVTCATRRERIAQGTVAAQAAAHLKAEHERRLWDEVYGGKSSRSKTSSMRARARQQESDQEVERNIAPELIPIWRKHKRQIRGSDRRTRTEAFEEWVHDNESDVRAELAELAHREQAKAEREYARQQAAWEKEQHEAQRAAFVRKHMRRGLSKTKAEQAARAELLADVPF